MAITTVRVEAIQTAHGLRRATALPDQAVENGLAAGIRNHFVFGPSKAVPDLIDAALDLRDTSRLKVT